MTISIKVAEEGMPTLHFSDASVVANLIHQATRRSSSIADERVRDVRFNEADIFVDLVDGRTISAPLAWYPRLLQATVEQREDWERAGAGYGIHWPQIDEDLSTDGLLRGAPAVVSKDHVNGV